MNSYFNSLRRVARNIPKVNVNFLFIPPGTFKKIGVNKNYLVNYVNAGRSVPRRKNFII